MRNLLIVFFIGFSLTTNAQSPSWTWVKGVTSFNSVGTGVTTDMEGDVYFTTYGPNPFIIDTFNLWQGPCHLIKSDANGIIKWTKNNINAYIKAIEIDANKNIYIAGEFKSNANFESIFLNGDAFSNIFIAKFDSIGNAIWAKTCGGTYYDYFSALTLDATGNPIITGYFSSITMTFDNIVLTNQDINHSSTSFLAKYDANGNAIWAKTASGNSGNSGIYPHSVTNDGTNIYFTGMFDTDSIIIGNRTLINSGNSDIFFAKYDGNGNLIWARRIGGIGDDFSNSVACDLIGNIILGGYFYSDSLAIGSNILTNSSSNYSSLFVKYDSNGNPIWAQSEESSSIKFVATDNANNSYFVGHFVDSLVLGSFHLIGLGGRNTFIAKKDSYGNDIWAKSVYTPLTAPTFNNSLTPMSISQRNLNSIYLTGYLIGQDCYFDSLHFVNPDTSGTTYNLFLAKINSLDVGIEQTVIINKYKIRVFPNPSKSQISISKYDLSSFSNYNLQIFNIQGKLVKEIKIQPNQNQINIDIQSFNSGMYFGKIVSESGESLSFKFVKE